jgi:hypothetical protein
MDTNLREWGWAGSGAEYGGRQDARPTIRREAWQLGCVGDPETFFGAKNPRDDGGATNCGGAELRQSGDESPQSKTRESWGLIVGVGVLSFDLWNPI